MRRIVLISCVSKKANYKTYVRDLYISRLFRYNLKYAESIKPDKIFILSAKYGLLKLDDEIEPYNEALNTKPVSEVRIWADRVISQLKNQVDLQNDEIIFLAGEKYRKFLLPFIKNYNIPLKGLSIGKQLQYLKGITK